MLFFIEKIDFIKAHVKVVQILEEEGFDRHSHGSSINVFYV